MPHYVYILRSLKDSRFYIGETSNVEQRLVFHDSGRQRSTKNRIPFELVYTEIFPDRTSALKREKEIKGYKGGNAFRKLISGCSPA